MKNMTFTRAVLLAFVLGQVLGAIHAAMAGIEDPMAPAEVPADGRISVTDYGYRDWGPELVHYRVDLKPQPFQGGDSCSFRIAMSFAVETCPPFLYLDFFGGGFLGPRGCFW